MGALPPATAGSVRARLGRRGTELLGAATAIALLAAARLTLREAARRASTSVAAGGGSADPRAPEERSGLTSARREAMGAEGRVAE